MISVCSPGRISSRAVRWMISYVVTSAVRDVGRLTGGTTNGTGTAPGAVAALGSSWAVWSAEALRPQPAAPEHGRAGDAAQRAGQQGSAADPHRGASSVGAARTGRTPRRRTGGPTRRQRPDRQQHAGRSPRSTPSGMWTARIRAYPMPVWTVSANRSSQQTIGTHDPAAGHGVPDARQRPAGSHQRPARSRRRCGCRARCRARRGTARSTAAGRSPRRGCSTARTRSARASQPKANARSRRLGRRRLRAVVAVVSSSVMSATL